MALTVNTNVRALDAQINVNKSNDMLSRSFQRLSSGLRINSAADDAAGLAIGTRLGAQVRGLNQAIRNANDGVAMLQTTEGSLGEISNILTRIKELAVQSATGSNSTADRSSANDEVQSLISEVTRIATQTTFGSTALLDGSFNAQFQVGVNAGETVGTSVANYRASSLSGAIASGTETLNADTSNVGVVDPDAYVGVSTTSTLQVQGPSGAAFARVAVAGDDMVSHMGNATSAIATAKVINERSSQTGVSATVTAATFTSATGGTAFSTVFDMDGTTADLTLKINGQRVTVKLDSAGYGVGVTARRNQFIDVVNAQITGVIATAVTTGANDQFTLTAADGRNISITAAGTADETSGGTIGLTVDKNGTEFVVARGGVTLQASGTVTTTWSAAAALQVGNEGTHADTSTTALSSLDVSTVVGANTAMLVADSILDSISTARGGLGAVMNRLGVTVSNLATVVLKVSDAVSRIMDADFAQETASLTKAQILQQAGIAILSQANSAPQAALKLLQ